MTSATLWPAQQERDMLGQTVVVIGAAPVLASKRLGSPVREERR